MLKNEIIERVNEMVQTGRYSLREIARSLGISHTMVSLIERGKRKTYKNKDLIIEPKGDLKRCPVCGQKTQLPCVYCQIVNILKNKKFTRLPESPGSEFVSDIQLKDEQYKRYCEVRDWRQNHIDPHFITIPDNWPWKTEVNKQNQ
ncbi:MAG: helix-turn-helix transcriptional regulator [Planctomycetia bacterium]|nr:helix-turn-helix transcriptional regulator [Planctomycetia bacterium]